MFGEQVRKATDAEWLGAELSRALATELLNSRQRSGQRGYDDVEPEGQPTEDPPADMRPDVHQISGPNVTAPGALASIPEQSDFMDAACHRPRKRDLRRDRVNPKANQAASRSTGTSDRGWCLN